MISPFGLTGCVINLIIGGICIFVHQHRAGRGWLIHAAAFHFAAAITYAFVIPYPAGPALEAHIRSFAGVPVAIGIAAVAILLPATILEMFDRFVALRHSLILTALAAIFEVLVAWLFEPFTAYILAHTIAVVVILTTGFVLVRGPTAFYRLTGISFLGRGVYSIFIIYMAARGASGLAYETALTLNLVFICLTGLGFVLIELDDARARIAEADHAKSQFIANMSHELRTPLNAVIGFSEMIESRHFALPVERCRDYAAHILTSARHLLSIINRLLDMASIEARRENLAPEEINLDEAIADCLHMASADAVAKGVLLQFDKPKQPTRLHADRRALSQIILSLTSNAVKFTRRNSPVSLQLEAEPGNETIRILIRDQGPGIAPSHLQKVFEPFWQAQNTYTSGQGGVGLGLAIARNLARGLGGDIAVETVVGSGSTFIITLPRRMPSPAMRSRALFRRRKQMPFAVE
jgi:signal transduction histidine kinase